MDTRVAEHRAELLRLLRSWIGEVARDAGTVPVDRMRDDVSAMARWLVDAGIDQHSDASAYLDTLTTWFRHGRRLTDSPPVRQGIDLCLHDEWLTGSGAPLESPCDGVVQARMPSTWHTPVLLVCRRCDSRWQLTDLPRVAGSRLAVADAARLLGVHRDTIYRWSRRGAISIGADGRVRVDEALAAMKKGRTLRRG